MSMSKYNHLVINVLASLNRKLDKHSLKIMKYKRTKSGNEFVEASIVLPIIILLIISIMVITSFLFTSLCTRCELHKSLLSSPKKDNVKLIKSINLNKEKRETSSDVTGLVESKYVKESSDIYFVISEADLIRYGHALQ